MKIIFLALVLVASAKSKPSKPITLEEFDHKFHIHEFVPDDQKDLERKRLQKAWAEKEAQNEAFAKGEGTFTEELNQMADIDKADFAKMYEGMKMPQEKTRATGLVMPPESERSTPENERNLEVAYRELAMTRQATSFDSREKGWVTAVKNQGNCGSCAAFAAHAGHEVTLVKAGAKLSGMDLSEQHLIDCGYDQDAMNGCNGASPHGYQNWFANNGGVSKLESNYPYLGTSPKLTCTAANKVANWNPGYKISKATWDYKCTEAKLLKLVAKHGAVAVGVYAADDAFGSYKSGVFNKCSKNDRRSCNHAVVVVGYGTDSSLGDYWIVKNSWGTNWGEKGYIRMGRGKTHCGIGTVCVWTEAAANGSAATTTAAPATTAGQTTTAGQDTTAGQTTAAPTTAAPTTAAPSNTKMWCDLTEILGGDDVTDTIRMRVWNMKKFEMFYSEIKCVKSQCTPAENGPTNACQYICGEDKCDEEHLWWV